MMTPITMDIKTEQSTAMSSLLLNDVAATRNDDDDDEFKAFLTTTFELTGVRAEYVRYLVRENADEFRRYVFTSRRADARRNYEEYEFVGDAIVTHFLALHAFDEIRAADATISSLKVAKLLPRIGIQLASRTTLSSIAARCDFAPHVRNSVARDNDDDKARRLQLPAHKRGYDARRSDESLLEDVFEAFVGAINILVQRRYGAATAFGVVYDFLRFAFDRAGIVVTTDYESLFDSKSLLKQMGERYPKEIGHIRYVHSREKCEPKSPTHFERDGCTVVYVSEPTENASVRAKNEQAEAKTALAYFNARGFYFRPVVSKRSPNDGTTPHQTAVDCKDERAIRRYRQTVIRLFDALRLLPTVRRKLLLAVDERADDDDDETYTMSAPLWFQRVVMLCIKQLEKKADRQEGEYKYLGWSLLMHFVVVYFRARFASATRDGNGFTEEVMSLMKQRYLSASFLARVVRRLRLTVDDDNDEDWRLAIFLQSMLGCVEQLIDRRFGRGVAFDLVYSTLSGVYDELCDEATVPRRDDLVDDVTKLKEFVQRRSHRLGTVEYSYDETSQRVSLVQRLPGNDATRLLAVVGMDVLPESEDTGRMISYRRLERVAAAEGYRLLSGELSTTTTGGTNKKRSNDARNVATTTTTGSPPMKCSKLDSSSLSTGVNGVSAVGLKSRRQRRREKRRDWQPMYDVVDGRGLPPPTTANDDEQRYYGARLAAPPLVSKQRCVARLVAPPSLAFDSCAMRLPAPPKAARIDDEQRFRTTTHRLLAPPPTGYESEETKRTG